MRAEAALEAHLQPEADLVVAARVLDLAAQHASRRHLPAQAGAGFVADVVDAQAARARIAGVEGGVATAHGAQGGVAQALDRRARARDGACRRRHLRVGCLCRRTVTEDDQRHAEQAAQKARNRGTHRQGRGLIEHGALL